MFRLPNINHPTDSGKIQQIADFLFQFIRQLNMDQESTKDTKPPSDSENTTIVVNKSAEDYIVEQGETIGKDTEGNDAITWTYRKWASGKAECWGSYTSGEINFTTTWGQLYTAKINDRIAYPFTFAERPQEIVTLRGKTHSAMLFSYTGEENIGVNNEKSTAVYGGTRGNTISGVVITLDFYVIGKWK